MSTAAKAPHWTGLSPIERRAAGSLALVSSLRMLGLFMILPVFSLYATDLAGVTPLLIGLAIGIYGLTQGLLQIPMGMLSDRVGRKPVIVAGLAVFAAGSAVAALSDSIHGVILGRALQGAGAISAAVMALAADLTRDEVRLRVMAVIGMSIGLSFALAMVGGPLVGAWVGLSGIFWLIAALALLGMATVAFVTPRPATRRFHRDTGARPAMLGSVLRRGELLRLDLGIFVLHLVLAASFVVVPLALRDAAGLPAERHWMLYLPVFLLSIAAVLPLLIRAERRRDIRRSFLAAIAALAAAELLLALEHDSLPVLFLLLALFFTAVNLLEAALPSLVAKTAPLDLKGTAMGVYSSSQFLGAFVGGLAGGALYGAFGYGGVFLGCAAALLVWLGLAAGMQDPDYVSTHLVHLGPVDAGQARVLAGRLAAVPGVSEALVSAEEGVAYLKIDRRRVDYAALDAFSVSDARTA